MSSSLVDRYPFSFLKDTRILLWVFISVSVIASIHRLFLGPDHIQNFLIFRNAFYNLVQSKDLYPVTSFGNLTLDLFKYSPSFALLFFPFAVLPVWLGYILWNILNAVALVFAIRSMKVNENKNWLILLLVFIDFLTSLQNAQSNSLMAALMIASFNSFENQRPGRAALFIILASFIKIFSLVACLLFLFYPEKLKFIFWSVLFTILFLAAPLLFVSFDQLRLLYESWGLMLKNDQDISAGISVMGILISWFGVNLSRTGTQIAGVILLCLPLLWWKKFTAIKTRGLMLCSLLIWVVIFNHRAESPSFVIAMSGIAIWYCMNTPELKKNILIVLALLLISLSPTDLFPRSIRLHYIVPYCLKALPAIIIWIFIQVELLNALRGKSSQ